MNHIDYFEMAADAAMIDKENERNFWIGSIGLRRDGAIVSARNGAVFSTQASKFELIPSSHAEGRILNKMDRGGTIYVARIAKLTRQYAMAAPCPMCQIRIKSFMIERVYYTINANQYGCWYVGKDYHKVFNG